MISLLLSEYGDEFPFELYNKLFLKVFNESKAEIIDYNALKGRFFPFLRACASTPELARMVALFGLALKNKHSSMYNCSETANFLEQQLPTMVERASDHQIRESLIDLLQQLVTSDDSFICSRVESIASRLCQGLLRIKDDSSLCYVLEAISVLARSRFHSAVKQTKGITAVCARGFARPDAMPFAASVLAALYSHEKPDLWSTRWRDHLVEIKWQLAAIGLVNVDETNDARGSSCPNDVVNTNGESNNNQSGAKKSKKSQAVSGSVRVLQASALLAAHCSVLKTMLHYGCSSGAIALPIDRFLALISTISSLGGTAGDSSSTSTIANSHGVSLAHVALVRPDLKYEVTSVLHAALQSCSTGGILLFGKPIIRCLCSLFCSGDTSSSPHLMDMLLVCTGAAARCFPTLFASTGGPILDALGQHFSKVVSLATQVPTTSSISSAPVARGEDVCGCCEAVIMHCGPFLPDDFWDTIDYYIGKALASCCKGLKLRPLTKANSSSRQLVSALDTDKDTKLRHAACETIRVDVGVRCAIINLATATLLSHRKDGALSANLVLLKRACLACMQLPGAGESKEVAKAMATISAIMHPASIPLPTVNLVQTLRSEVSDRMQSAFEGKSLITRTDSADGADGLEVESVPTKESEQGLENEGSARTQRKRSVQVVEEEQQQSFASTTLPSKVVKIQEDSRGVSTVSSDGVMQADDDDDIPDINF